MSGTREWPVWGRARYPGSVSRVGVFFVLSVVSTFGAGCEVSQGRSCDLQAEAISMAATVIDDDEGVEVELGLEAGDMSGVGTSLKLCDTEGESVMVNGKPLTLTETYAGNYKYRHAFDQAQDVYTFELRVGSDEQEITADLEPPPQFSIDAPLSGAELGRGEDAQLAWSPPVAGETIKIELIDDELLCLEDWEAETEDDGTHVIPAGTIVRTDPDTPDGACQAEYLFTRQRTGPYPSELAAGGSLEAFVRRGVRFASVL